MARKVARDIANNPNHVLFRGSHGRPKSPKASQGTRDMIMWVFMPLAY